MNAGIQIEDLALYRPRCKRYSAVKLNGLALSYLEIMERRASIPPGTPKPSPTASCWQDPPSAISSHRSTTDLPNKASIVVIGSGITGATIAYTLRSQSSPPSVLMLEARTACSGATGRNGGHTKCASYRSFMDNVRAHGEEEAAKIAKFEYNCMRAVHAFAKDHQIQCDSWQGDTVDIIYDEDQWSRAKAAVSQLRRVLGAQHPATKYTFWNAEEVESHFLAKGALGALSYEAGSLSAYKFVCGILTLALREGLNLQTETPALRVSRASGSQRAWIIDTPRGCVEAEKVIMATNGYTAHLYPPVQGIIVPLRGHMTAQNYGQAMPKGSLSNTYSFIYADGYEYMVPQSKGYMMIGGGLTMGPNEGLLEFGTTDDTTKDPVIADYLCDCTERYFGSNWGEDHPDGRVHMAWTGIMGFSTDGFPLVGPVPDGNNLYIAASFQGSGMVLCFHSAIALVSMLSEEEGNGLNEWFPRSFCMSKDRLKSKFRGRLHMKAPMELGAQSQL